jgi:hypothetical protein
VLTLTIEQQPIRELCARILRLGILNHRMSGHQYECKNHNENSGYNDQDFRAEHFSLLDIMVKYHSRTTKTKKAGRKSRKQLRKKTMAKRPRKVRGGYSPVGPDGGAQGKVPDSYPSQQSGALPNPISAAGLPIGKIAY